MTDSLHSKPVSSLHTQGNAATEQVLSGVLYVVATPIGNLSDMSPRAVQVLQAVDLLAAEDTRRSRVLCDHFNIDTRLVAYHDHSNDEQAASLIGKLLQGQAIALISDAGTPLISDPGYSLVTRAKSEGIRVVPIPGACALVAALSAAGLPTDRFTFEGFLPAKAEARLKYLRALSDQPRTMVFYEAPHRIEAFLQSLVDVFGEQREVVVARELTKRYETLLRGSLAEVLQSMLMDSNQRRGEFVVMLRGLSKADASDDEQAAEADRVLSILLESLPVRQAATTAAKLTGMKKNYLYGRALELNNAL